MCFVDFRTHGFTLLELLMAIALGAFVCVGIFHLYFSLNYLSQRERAISDFAENTRFIGDFLRNKINTAGNWSCLLKSPGSRSFPVKGYDSDESKNKLGLTIKSGTDLLQLKECIRLHGKMQYQPVEFFVANTFREVQHHCIYALFFKVGHHPREELITGMTKFNLLFGVQDRTRHNIRAYHAIDSIRDWHQVGIVKIKYLLTSAIAQLSQPGVLYAGLWSQKK